MSSKRKRQREKRRTDRTRREAFVALEEGNPARARRIIERAIDAWPNNARSWFDRGRILLASGEPEEALGSFRRALELAPTWTAPRERLVALAGLDAVPEEYRPPPSIPAFDDDGEPPPDLGRTEPYDWIELEDEALRRGAVTLPALLGNDERAALAEIARETPLRSALPLRVLPVANPSRIASLREELYWRVAPIVRAYCEAIERDCIAPRAWSGWPEREAFLGGSPPPPAAIDLEPGVLHRLHPGGREADAMPLRALLVLEAGGPADARVELRLIDEGVGRRKRPFRMDLAAGDGVLVCVPRRLRAIGGLFGVQRVAVELVAPSDAGVLVLDLPLVPLGPADQRPK